MTDIYMYNYVISVPTVKYTLIILKQEMVDKLSTLQPYDKKVRDNHSSSLL
jgi:hypothetical protein